MTLGAFIRRDDVTLKQPVIVSSVPKCGTHLLMNIIVRIFGTNNVHGFEGEEKTALINEDYIKSNELSSKFYFGHIWYSNELSNKIKNIPKIILVRDPRDYVVSQAHFWDNFKGKENKIDEYFQKLDSMEKISCAILGVATTNGILHSVYDMFLNCAIKWLDSSCIVVRYEDLISSIPNTIEEKSVNVVKSIIKFVVPDNNLDLDLKDEIYHGSDSVLSPTFRKGGSGQWMDEFQQIHVKQFKTVAPNLVSSLGYENDENWDLESECFDFKSIPSSITLPGIIDKISDRYVVLNETQYSERVKNLIDIWTLNRYMEISDHANSLNLLNQLLEKDPNNGSWNYLKAFCLHMLNKEPDTALYHYDIAERNGYDEFWIKYNRGSLYVKLGKKELARADLEKAQILNPKFEEIQKILSTLN